MLLKYLLARYTLYCKLIDQHQADYDRTQDTVYEEWMLETMHRQQEVNKIMDDVFGREVAFNARIEARKHAEETDIMELYAEINRYKA